MKKWSGRFKKKGIKCLYSFTSSIYFDSFLFKYDILSTLVHIKILLKLKVINLNDFRILKKSLKFIKSKKKFKENFEDIHLNLENFLIKYTGNLGKKIRTSRSRNDLVNSDLKMWIFDRNKVIICKIITLLKTILFYAKKSYKKIFVGFTHFQVAQPITFGHYLMAYYEIFKRDLEKLIFFSKFNNSCPLGCCALAGTSFKIDRKFYSSKLFFKNAYKNSIDGVSDRDYVVDFLYVLSLIVLHISKFSEDIINYSNNCLSIINLGDEICTGSSIMPQKKNPDIFEVLRSKTGTIIGNMIAMLIVLKSQTQSYNKDNQEDKRKVVDSYFEIKNILNIFIKSIKKIKVNSKLCKKILNKNFSTATDLADFFTKNGIPFKKSHEIVSRIVSYCIKKKKKLNEVKISNLNKKLISTIKKNKISFPKISIYKSLNSKISFGGTSPKRVKKSIIYEKKYINEKINFLNKNF
ncbi:argininosuccinate lyase [Candidatus Vidania fulgoroideae]|uniref:Argininosuccinate lyase n=1 Tax=Candidatus Vidania fulgoroideorum TaxID=881286 RepID=A0AAX3N8F6_9PROT|nr:argininosuccinate lyase [Candidatus Vidania fulgoroideae]